MVAIHISDRLYQAILALQNDHETPEDVMWRLVNTAEHTPTTASHLPEHDVMALYQAVTLLLDARSLSAMAEQVAQTIVESFNQVDCGVILVSRDGRTLWRAARSGAQKARPVAPLRIDSPGLVPTAIRTGQVIYAPDVRQQPDYVRNDPDSLSELVVPLQGRDRMLGVLDLQSRQVNAFDDHARLLIETFAQEAAMALENMLLYDEVRHQTAELERRVEQRTQALARTKSRIEMILNSSIDGIVLVDTDQRIQQTNAGFNALLGYTSNELFDMKLHHLCADDVVFAPGRFEAAMIRRDGSTFYADISVSDIDDDDEGLMVCIFRDVTQRKRAEHELHLTTQRLRGLFERNNDTVFFISPDAKILDVNAQVKKSLGYDPADLIGRSAFDLIKPDELPEARDYFQHLVTGDLPPHYERTFIRADGSYMPGEVNLALVYDNEGQPQHIQSIVRDISTHKAIEENLRNALESERELNALKSRFVSMVSHEFRTPLTSILSSSGLIRKYHDRLTPEKREKQLQRIERQVKRLTSLMDSTIIISRAATQGLEYHPAQVDVALLCRETIDEVCLEYEGERVVLHIAPDLPLVWADENLLHLILQNLLSNAVKYSRDEGTVTIDVRLQAHLLHLTIHDEGIGIPQRDHQHLFQTFHRASNVGTVQGTGLGLAIVKLAAEAHGGTVTFHSQEGVGTKFHVSLVLMPPDDDDHSYSQNVSGQSQPHTNVDI